MIDIDKERKEFEAWHVEFCSRKPRLDALPGLCTDDKKAWAAWQARAYAEELRKRDSIRAVAEVVDVNAGILSATVDIQPPNILMVGDKLYLAPPAAEELRKREGGVSSKLVSEVANIVTDRWGGDWITGRDRESFYRDVGTILTVAKELEAAKENNDDPW